MVLGRVGIIEKRLLFNKLVLNGKYFEIVSVSEYFIDCFLTILKIDLRLYYF